MKRTPIVATFTILVCLVVAMSAWPGTATAALSSTPDAGVCVTNGTVWAIAIAPDGSAYIGGEFTEVGGLSSRRSR